MPRGKADSASKKGKETLVSKPDDFDWGGFINVRISDEDKAAFDLWAAETESTMWVDFQELVAKGFKFSLSYDGKGDFYLATFTAAGRALIGIDLRCCLTARAPEWEVAIHLLMFKHEVMARGDWGTYKPSDLRFANFG